MTVDEIYNLTIKSLPTSDRVRLKTLIDDGLRHESEPPNTPHTREELITMLEEGMKGPFTPLTPQDWQDIRDQLDARATARRNRN